MKKRTHNSRNKKNPSKPIVYADIELDVLEQHITTHFGDFANVIHEIVSPDIHVDIAVIEPTSERNYYIMITMGMGAYRMNVPPQLAEYKLDRAEMVICLHPDWKVMDGDEKWYWPLRWLKIMARLPLENNTWLGIGHTVPNGEPFADNTKLSGIGLLSSSVEFGEESNICTMHNDNVINFYQMFPLHEEEMNFKCANNFDTLLNLMPEDISVIVDVDRPSVV